MRDPPAAPGMAYTIKLKRIAYPVERSGPAHEFIFAHRAFKHFNECL